MNLQQLYYFRKLAEIQNYTRASKLLYITQPTLSKAIGTLEEELGVALFQKNGRSVELTKLGEVFYHHINIALTEIQIGKEKIDHYNHMLQGSINIASIPTLQSTFVMDAMSGFTESVNDKIKIHIFYGFSPSIFSGVMNGSYDIGFCHLPKNKSFPGLNSNEIVPRYLKLAVPIKHPDYKNVTEISLNDLTHKKIITYRTNNYIGADIAEYLDPYHLNIEFDYDDDIILTSIVAQNNNIAFVLDVPDNCYHSGIRLIPITEAPEVFHSVSMIWTDAPKTYIQELFISYIKKLTDSGIRV